MSEGARHGRRTWFVAEKGFVWERSFSKADIKRFGDAPIPEGPIIAVRIEDLDGKEEVLAGDQPGFFTIPHFDGYSAVLIQLKKVRKRALRGSDHRRLAGVRTTETCGRVPGPLSRQSTEAMLPSDNNDATSFSESPCSMSTSRVWAPTGGAGAPGVGRSPSTSGAGPG